MSAQYLYKLLNIEVEVCYVVIFSLLFPQTGSQTGSLRKRQSFTGNSFCGRGLCAIAASFAVTNQNALLFHRF